MFESDLCTIDCNDVLTVRGPFLSNTACYAPVQYSIFNYSTADGRPISRDQDSIFGQRGCNSELEAS